MASWQEIADQEDAAPTVQKVLWRESGGKNYDKNGNVLTSPAGAKAAMQVVDGTNTNPGFGVRPAQNNSVDERNRVGRDYLNALIMKYGSEDKAMAAYNAGPGRVDQAIAQGGANWQKLLPAETKNYIVGAKSGAPTPPTPTPTSAAPMATATPTPSLTWQQIADQEDAKSPPSSAVPPQAPAEPGLLDKTMTAIRGFGQGATAGLIQYPQAILKQAGRNLNGEPDSPTNSFKSNLADLRGENTDLATSQPAQWYGGNAAGAVTSGVISGGSTLGGLAARGAVQGGTEGFTQNENLGDAAVGVGLGGTLGAIGGGASTWLNGLKAQALKQAAERSVAADLGAVAGKTAEKFKGQDLEAFQTLVQENLAAMSPKAAAKQVANITAGDPGFFSRIATATGRAFTGVARNAVVGGGGAVAANTAYNYKSDKPLLEDAPLAFAAGVGGKQALSRLGATAAGHGSTWLGRLTAQNPNLAPAVVGGVQAPVVGGTVAGTVDAMNPVPQQSRLQILADQFRANQ